MKTSLGAGLSDSRSLWQEHLSSWRTGPVGKDRSVAGAALKINLTLFLLPNSPEVKHQQN